MSQQNEGAPSFKPFLRTPFDYELRREEEAKKSLAERALPFIVGDPVVTEQLEQKPFDEDRSISVFFPRSGSPRIETSGTDQEGTFEIISANELIAALCEQIKDTYFQPIPNEDPEEEIVEDQQAATIYSHQRIPGRPSKAFRQAYIESIPLSKDPIEIARHATLRMSQDKSTSHIRTTHTTIYPPNQSNPTPQPPEKKAQIIFINKLIDPQLTDLSRGLNIWHQHIIHYKFQTLGYPLQIQTIPYGNSQATNEVPTSFAYELALERMKTMEGQATFVFHTTDGENPREDTAATLSSLGEIVKKSRLTVFQPCNLNHLTHPPVSLIAKQISSSQQPDIKGKLKVVQPLASTNNTYMLLLHTYGKKT